MTNWLNRAILGIIAICVAGVLSLPALSQMFTPPINFIRGSSCTLTYTTNLALKVVSNVGITQSGGTVSSWADQSGNARDLTEATNKPAYNATGLNSLPTITFDGTNDVLTSPAWAQANPFTVFSVIKIVTNNSGDGVMGGTGVGDEILMRGAASVPLGDQFTTDGPDPSLTTGTWYIVKWLGNGTSSVASKNNGADVTSATNVSHGFVTAFELGTSSGRGFGNIEIAANLIYNEAVTGTSTTGNQKTVIDYLNCLYVVF